MNVSLTPHAAELLEIARAQHQENDGDILEHALEVFIREQHIGPKKRMSPEDQRLAVSEVLDFIERNRVHLGAGLSVRDLIHEGHRV